MMGPLLRVGWISLKRDRAALFLTFVLPVAFFTIFAMVFASMGGDGVEEIELRVLLVDQDGSDISRDLAASLAAQEVLSLSTAPEVTTEEEKTAGEAPSAWTREAAFRAVRMGEADAAVVLTPGFGDRFGDFAGATPEVELIYDASNPMARFTLSGLLQASSFQSSPDVLLEKGVGMFEQFGAGLTPEQQQVLELAKPMMESGQMPGAGGSLIEVQATAAHEDEDEDENEERQGFIAYYAAGIGVMFLLFSMTGAAGGLLEEEERGTLERLLTSNVSMSLLLGSRWVFFTVMGALQVLLMFVWGWAMFGLDLWTPNRFLGVVVVSVATASAAASFGLVLAAACKSRAQLGGLSTIVVLVMSALGGSMMPRFLMPDFMNTVSKFTLNGWALDGFLKVFWYDDPEAGLAASLWDLAPQLAMLALMAVTFFVAARRLARRWEVV